MKIGITGSISSEISIANILSKNKKLLLDQIVRFVQIISLKGKLRENIKLKKKI